MPSTSMLGVQWSLGALEGIFLTKTSSRSAQILGLEGPLQLGREGVCSARVSQPGVFRPEPPQPANSAANRAQLADPPRSSHRPGAWRLQLFGSPLIPQTNTGREEAGTQGLAENQARAGGDDFSAGSQFARGGRTMADAGIVGENGRELEYTGASQIYTSRANGGTSVREGCKADSAQARGSGRSLPRWSKSKAHSAHCPQP